MGILNKLRRELSDSTAPSGVSALSEKYLDLVAGGEGGTFSQYTQNHGDPGPHPGPFWEQVVITPG